MGPELISFFIVLFAAVFFSALFARLHLPWAVALIVGGIIIGPHSLGLFEPSDTLLFMSQIGLIFLMFMAGLEMRFASFKERAGGVTLIGFLNGALPFVVGFLIALTFGFGTQTALLIGIIFVSSSIAVVVHSLQANLLIGTKLGDAIIGSTMLQDIASLVLLSIFFQTSGDFTTLPLPLFYILLFAFLVFLRWAIPRLETLMAKTSVFQQELRSVFVVLIGTVIVFEVLGLHPIIAGFFAGLVLSDRLNHGPLKEKLRAISYGLFIPIFFVVVGSQTDIAAFGQAQSALFLVGALVLGSILSKFVSGWLAARFVGFTNTESSLIGITSVPQLSTTLAVVFSGFALGLISAELVSALVVLSIVTTLIAPFLTTVITNRLTPAEKET